MFKLYFDFHLFQDGASGIVTDYNTSGMKELDLISKEIDDIKR